MNIIFIVEDNGVQQEMVNIPVCLLYTSDAADEL